MNATSRFALASLVAVAFPVGAALADGETPGPEDPTGACCLRDGSCTDGQSQAACATVGGIYRGDGSECASVDCPTFGPCGWIIDAPATVAGNTVVELNTCPLDPSVDAQFQVDISFPGDWTFSICDAAFDSILAVGEECCAGEWINDDAPGCFVGSELLIPGLQAGTYFVNVEGGVGTYTLEVFCTSCCIEDINGDGVVNVLDMLLVLAAWGGAGGPEDVNGDGIVNVSDLLLVLAAWGPC